MVRGTVQPAALLLRACGLWAATVDERQSRDCTTRPARRGRDASWTRLLAEILRQPSHWWAGSRSFLVGRVLRFETDECRSKTRPAGRASGTFSKNSTTPVSSEYSAPTTSRPVSGISFSSSSDPCRRWFTDARTLARTASRSETRPGRLAASRPAESRPMGGRDRRWSAGSWTDSSAAPCSSSSVAMTAPHCECPMTTTSRVPNRDAANSTLPTCDGATMFPATRMTKRSPKL